MNKDIFPSSGEGDKGKEDAISHKIAFNIALHRPRYLGGIFERPKSIDIKIIHAIIWAILAVLSLARYIQFLEFSTTPKM